MPKVDEEQIRAEIEQQLPGGLTIVFEDVFPKLKGMGTKKANKQKLDYLNRAAELLRLVLEPDEKVHVVSRARVNYFSETYFMGWMALLVNNAILISTQKRVLIIHATHKFTPHLYVNEIPGTAIKKVGASLGSVLIYTNKENRHVSYISALDRKTLQRLFPKNETAQGGIRRLCSSCFEPHDKHANTCNRCGVAFKSPETAALRSLFLPGLGDWYIGHRNVALLEMLGSIFTWLLVIVLVAAAITQDSLIELLIAGFLLVVVNVVDALLTRWQARKGLMSTDGFLPSRQRGPRHPSDDSENAVPAMVSPVNRSAAAEHPGDKVSVVMYGFCAFVVVVMIFMAIATGSVMTDPELFQGEWDDYGPVLQSDIANGLTSADDTLVSLSDEEAATVAHCSAMKIVGLLNEAGCKYHYDSSLTSEAEHLKEQDACVDRINLAFKSEQATVECAISELEGDRRFVGMIEKLRITQNLISEGRDQDSAEAIAGCYAIGAQRILTESGCLVIQPQTTTMAQLYGSIEACAADPKITATLTEEQRLCMQQYNEAAQAGELPDTPK